MALLPGDDGGDVLGRDAVKLKMKPTREFALRFAG
jgi:hypothetical protein